MAQTSIEFVMSVAVQSLFDLNADVQHIQNKLKLSGLKKDQLITDLLLPGVWDTF